MINFGQLINFVTGHTKTHGIGHIPNAIRSWHGQFTAKNIGRFWVFQIKNGIKTIDANFQATQSFL